MWTKFSLEDLWYFLSSPPPLRKGWKFLGSLFESRVPKIQIPQIKGGKYTNWKFYRRPYTIFQVFSL